MQIRSLYRAIKAVTKFMITLLAHKARIEETLEVEFWT